MAFTFHACTVSRPARISTARHTARRLCQALGNGVYLEQVEDRFISRLLESCLKPERRDGFVELREKSLRSLMTTHMPTTREESFRFTDLKPILQSEMQEMSDRLSIDPDILSEISLNKSDGNRVVIVDGIVRWEMSHLTAEMQSVVGIRIPEGVQIDSPLHLLYVSTGKDMKRILTCEKGSRIEIVEEFMTLPSTTGIHLTLPVCEMEIHENATLIHQYVQLNGPRVYHLKSTLVNQEMHSNYHLVELTIGGRLSRHDLDIDQNGEGTETEMRHFHLVDGDQLHDLHSTVVLDHVDGVVNQMHKCIVTSSTGSGVFDGNVKVNQKAQKTDAGQLSRNLLLAPRATVNVKPNLQIVADDVKCTHGCTVADLSDEEIFYFRARGVNSTAARRMLVYSFGAEIADMLSSDALRKRVDKAMSSALTSI